MRTKEMSALIRIDIFDFNDEEANSSKVLRKTKHYHLGREVIKIQGSNLSKGIIIGIILGLIVGFSGGYYYQQLNASEPVTTTAFRTTDSGLTKVNYAATAENMNSEVQKWFRNQATVQAKALDDAVKAGEFGVYGVSSAAKMKDILGNSFSANKALAAGWTCDANAATALSAAMAKAKAQLELWLQGFCMKDGTADITVDVWSAMSNFNSRKDMRLVKIKTTTIYKVNYTQASFFGTQCEDKSDTYTVVTEKVFIVKNSTGEIIKDGPPNDMSGWDKDIKTCSANGKVSWINNNYDREKCCKPYSETSGGTI